MSTLLERAQQRLTPAPAPVSTLPPEKQEMPPSQGIPQPGRAPQPGMPPQGMPPQGMPPQGPQGAPPQAPQDQLPPDTKTIQGAGIENVTPQERQMAEAVMANATDWMYGAGWDFVVQELQNDEPSKAAGKVAARTLLEQEQMAEIAKIPIPNTIKFDIGQQIVEELFTIMETQGIYKPKDPSEENTKMTEALMYATEYWASNAIPAGRVTASERNQLGSDLAAGKYDHINLQEPAE